MFAYSHVTSQPAFYLLIAVTVILTLGFSWGRRRNLRILHGTLDAISAVLKPRDQRYTNIGGQTGYHANFVPGAFKSVRRVDATMTLLPRQSWLYLPFSILVRKFDRLFLTFVVNKRARGSFSEGHLIEQRFERLRGNAIANAATLASEEIQWGPMTFRLYYEDDEARLALLDLKSRLGEPDTVRHAALVPAQDALYLFQIPRPESARRVVATFRDWFDEFVSGKEAAE